MLTYSNTNHFCSALLEKLFSPEYQPNSIEFTVKGTGWVQRLILLDSNTLVWQDFSQSKEQWREIARLQYELDESGTSTLHYKCNTDYGGILHKCSKLVLFMLMKVYHSGYCFHVSVN